LIDLRQTKTNITTGPFYTYRRIHLHTYIEYIYMLRFVIFVRNYPGGLHAAAATWLCTYIFISTDA